MFFLVAAAYSYAGTNLSNGGGEGGHDVRQAEAAYPERNASGWTQVCVDVAEVEPATFVFLYVVLPAGAGLALLVGCFVSCRRFVHTAEPWTRTTRRRTLDAHHQIGDA